MALRDMLFGNIDKHNEGFSPLTPEHRERRKLQAMLWAYYRGHHRRPLRVQPNMPDDNVTLNLSKRIVNKGVQFLFGKSVDFEIDTETRDRTPDEQYLDDVWGTDEDKHTLLQNIATNGGVTGTAVVRLYEPEQGVRDALPRIVNIDPALLDVVTNEDDVEDVRAYTLTWKAGEAWKRHRFDMQPNDTWIVTEQIARPNNTDWQITAEFPWPYPFAPIQTAQNLPCPNEFWGMSDLEEADINDAINFTASNMNRILRFHAHPKTIGLGFNANDLQKTDVDSFWTIGNAKTEVDVYNLEMQSDLASAYNYLNMLKQMYAKVTSVPDLDPAVVNVGALSGFALRILYGDLLETTQTKRNTYGKLLSEINACVLALGKKQEYGSVDVKNVWQDPLPSNGMEEAQTLQIDKANGLSTETYLERRHYDPDKEMERRKADQAEQRANMAQMMTDAERRFDREDEDE